MRELAVFYCPKCGHYAYYQTSRHPQCPKCGTQEAMYMVRMHYTEFMRMSCDERDEFLSREILKTNPSLITRLTEPHRRYNSREIIAEMNNVIMNLDIENKILSDTVKWMHDTIWELMGPSRLIPFRIDPAHREKRLAVFDFQHLHVVLAVLWDHQVDAKAGDIRVF